MVGKRPTHRSKEQNGQSGWRPTCQMTFSEDTKANEWRKDNLQQIEMEQVNIYMQKVKFDASCTICKKRTPNES